MRSGEGIQYHFLPLFKPPGYIPTSNLTQTQDPATKPASTVPLPSARCPATDSPGRSTAAESLLFSLETLSKPGPDSPSLTVAATYAPTTAGRFPSYEAQAHPSSFSRPLSSHLISFPNRSSSYPIPDTKNLRTREGFFAISFLSPTRAAELAQYLLLNTSFTCASPSTTTQDGPSASRQPASAGTHPRSREDAAMYVVIQPCLKSQHSISLLEYSANISLSQSAGLPGMYIQQRSLVRSVETRTSRASKPRDRIYPMAREWRNADTCSTDTWFS